MRRRHVVTAAAALLAAPAPSGAQTAGTAGAATPVVQSPVSGHVHIGGLSMYYERHGGGGVPLVVLHGAFSSIHNSFGTVIPGLSATREVVGFDYQGHGRTADVDRPLRVDSIAEDIVAALDTLGLEQVDVMGYSTGALIAQRIALRHPTRVRKLVLMSATYRLDGVRAGLMEGLGEMQPSMMYGTPWHANYLELSPKPDFDRLFRKKTEMDRHIGDLSDAEVRGLTQPVLLIAGDSDLPALDHLATFFRLVGGDVFGDTPAGLPRSQLAILPGASHVTTPFQTEVLLHIIPAFLDRVETSAPSERDGQR